MLFVGFGEHNSSALHPSSLIHSVSRLPLPIPTPTLPHSSYIEQSALLTHAITALPFVYIVFGWRCFSCKCMCIFRMSVSVQGTWNVFIILYIYIREINAAKRHLYYCSDGQWGSERQRKSCMFRLPSLYSILYTTFTSTYTHAFIYGIFIRCVKRERVWSLPFALAALKT